MLQFISVKTKLILCFGIMVVLLAILLGLSFHQMSVLNAATADIGHVRLTATQALGRIQELTLRVRVNGSRLLSAETATQRGDAKTSLDQRLAELTQQQAAYLALPAPPGTPPIYGEFETRWNGYLDLQRQAIEKAERGDTAGAVRSYNTEMSDGIRAVIAALGRLGKLNEAAAIASVEAAGAAHDRGRLQMLGVLVLSVVLAAGAASLLVLEVSRPLGRMTAAMRRLSSGDTGTAIPEVGRRDEIGGMAAAVQVFKESMIRARALDEESARVRAGSEAQRSALMRDMADDFERAVGGIIASVTTAATQLQMTAQSMTGTARETAGQSTSVVIAAEEAAANVNAVAAAAAELGSSVGEIGRQVEGSARLAQAAVAEADQTGTLVQDLSTAAARISDVVALISSIAGQTNLLALNATIEAARAGEAGRGFAVVAAEVKELANETARATDEIAGQIGRIQGSTEQAVQAIGGIARRIQEISGVATAISAAVEEQGAATREIVRNVSLAAAGTSDVTGHIAGVAGAAEETGAAATQVLASATDLSGQSHQLDAEVTRFLSSVRAA